MTGQLVNKRVFTLVSYLLCSLGLSFAQSIVTTYFDLDELGDIPGVIEVSTDYLTIIEFEGYDVERANTARADLYTLEIVENTVVIRANEDVINTDLFARVAGRTVLFRLESAPTSNNPRRYVVREAPTPQRGIERQDSAGGATRPNRADAEARPLFPLGLQFEAEVLQFRQNEIIIQYRLINESEHPIVNDPLRLRVYYGDTSIYRQLERAPVPGRPNFLAPGEAEAGQILIPKAPSSLDDIELEWVLIEVGPGTQHLLLRNLGALAESGPGSRLAQVPATQVPLDKAEETSTDVTPSEVAEPTVSPQPLDSADSSAKKAEAVEAEKADEDAAKPELSAEAVPASSSPFIDSDFEKNSGDWYVWLGPDSGAEASGEMIGGEYCVNVTSSGSKDWHVRFVLDTLPLENGYEYLLRYDAYADTAFQLKSGIILSAAPYTDYSWHDNVLTGNKTTFEHRFILEQEEDAPTMLLFLLGQQEATEVPYTVCFDNVQLSALGPAQTSGDVELPEPSDISSESGAGAVDTRFDNGTGAWELVLKDAEATGSIVSGEYCLEVTKSGFETSINNFGLGGLSLQAGQAYTLRFDAYANRPVTLRHNVLMDAPPWTTYGSNSVQIETNKTGYEHRFTLGKEDNALSGVAFYLASPEEIGEQPYRLCLDNIQLIRTSSELDEEAATQPFVSTDFEDGSKSAWNLGVSGAAEATDSVQNGEYCVSITNAGESPWNVGFYLSDLNLTPEHSYLLRYDAYADKEASTRYALTLDGEPWTGYAGNSSALNTTKQTFEHRFYLEKTKEEGRALRLAFFLGYEENTNQAPYQICLDNIRLDDLDASSAKTGVQAPAQAVQPEADVMIVNSNFETGIEDEWVFYVHDSAEASMEEANGEACFTVRQTGKQMYRIGFLQRDQRLQAGQTYSFGFDAYADQPVEIHSGISLQEEPWTVYQAQRETLSVDKRSYSYEFTMPNDENKGRLIFEMGGQENASLDPYRICLDNIYLGTVGETQPSSDASGSALLIVDTSKPNAVDTSLKRRLEALGYSVSLKDDDTATPLDADNRDLVVISSSIERDALAPGFRDVPVPIVTFEEWAYAKLGMTGPVDSQDFEDLEEQTELHIIMPKHPLSAGLSGTTVVSKNPASLAWGVPGKDALVIATLLETPERATLFAYEAGAQMIGMLAPARRVGLFHDYKDVTYNDNGWSLFEAAVRWVSARPSTTFEADSEVVNGDFEDGSGEPWNLFFNKDSTAQVETEFQANEYCVTVKDPGSEQDTARLVQIIPGLAQGNYEFQFDAYADKPVTLGYWVRPDGEGKNFFASGNALTPDPQTFRRKFNQDRSNALDSRLVYNFITPNSREFAPFTVCLDNIRIAKPGGAQDPASEKAKPADTQASPLFSSSFEKPSKAWRLHVDEEGGAAAQGKLANGEYCLTIEKPGTKHWHVNTKVYNLTMQKNQSYQLSWKAWSERPVIMRSKVARASEPFTTYGGHWETTLGSSKVAHSYSFVAEVDDPEAMLEFQLGADHTAGNLPVKICFDDVELIAVRN